MTDEAPSSEARPGYQYWAFISYSSKDRAAAKWLHNALETYRLPVQLLQHPTPAGEPAPKHFKPLFWDRAELQAHHDLGELIERSLRESRYLVVICSPNSAKSPWVEKEIQAFQKMHGPARILSLIIAGNPGAQDDTNCFPPTLRAREPKAPDARPEGDGRTNAKLMLLATMLGVNFDALKRRDQERKMRLLGISLTGALVVLTCMGWLAWRESVARKGETEAKRIAEQNAVEADRQRKVADEQRQVAEDQTRQVAREKERQDKLLWEASRGDHEAAVRAFELKKPHEGLAYFARALKARPDNAAAMAAAAMHAAGVSAPLLQTRWVSQAPSATRCLASSPDGQTVATGCEDGTLLLLSAINGDEKMRRKMKHPVDALTWHPSGDMLVAGGRGSKADNDEKGPLWILNPQSGQIIRQLEVGAPVLNLQFSPDGSKLVVITRYGAGLAFSTETWKETVLGPAESLCISPDSKRAALVLNNEDAAEGGGDMGGIVIVDLSSGRTIKQVKLKPVVTEAVFTPSGDRLFIGTRGSAFILDSNTLQTVHETRPAHDARCAVSNPDGTQCAIGAQAIHLIDLLAKTEASTTRLESRESVGMSHHRMSYTPDGRWLVSLSGDNALRLLEAKTGRVLETMELGAPVEDFALGADGFHVFLRANDQSLRCVEIGRGCQPALSVAPLRYRAKSPDGRWAVRTYGDENPSSYGQSTTLENLLIITDTRSGDDSRTVSCGDALRDILFASDSGAFYTSSFFRSVMKFEAETTRKLWVADCPRDVESICLPVHERWLAAACSDDRSLRLLDVQTGITRRKWIVNDIRPVKVACSPDGKLIAAGYYEGSVQIFDADAEQPLAGFTFGKAVDQLQFDASGRLLLAGSDDETTRVIDVAAKREVSRFRWLNGVDAAIFMPDARWYAATALNTTCLIETESGKEIARYESERNSGAIELSDDKMRLIFPGQKRDASMDLQWFPKTGQTAPAAWISFVQFLSGFVHDEQGRKRPLNQAEWEQCTRHIRQQKGQDWSASIIRWAFSPPETRTTSPWTSEPIRVAAGHWLMTSISTTPTISEFADQAPWHPLVPLSLARKEELPGSEAPPGLRKEMLLRPRFLWRLTLDRLRHADANLYGAETLGRYAAWCAKILHQELNLDAEALEALAFALERTPLEKQKDLLELKATIEGKQPG